MRTVIDVFLPFSDRLFAIVFANSREALFIIKLFDNSFVAQHHTISIYYLYNGLENNWSLDEVYQRDFNFTALGDKSTDWLRQQCDQDLDNQDSSNREIQETISHETQELIKSETTLLIAFLLRLLQKF